MWWYFDFISLFERIWWLETIYFCEKFPRHIMLISKRSDVCVSLECYVYPMIDNPLTPTTSDDVEKYERPEESKENNLSDESIKCWERDKPDSGPLEYDLGSLSIGPDLRFRTRIIRNSKARTIESSPERFFEVKIPVRNFSSEDRILTTLFTIFESKEIPRRHSYICIDRDITDIFDLGMYDNSSFLTLVVETHYFQFSLYVTRNSDGQSEACTNGEIDTWLTIFFFFFLLYEDTSIMFSDSSIFRNSNSKWYELGSPCW